MNFGALRLLNDDTVAAGEGVRHASAPEHGDHRDGNGIFIFAVNGSITVGGESESHHLGKRDGLGVIDASSLEITADTDATFIIIDVPMG